MWMILVVSRYYINPWWWYGWIDCQPRIKISIEQVLLNWFWMSWLDYTSSLKAKKKTQSSNKKVWHCVYWLRLFSQHNSNLIWMKSFGSIIISIYSFLMISVLISNEDTETYSDRDRQKKKEEWVACNHSLFLFIFNFSYIFFMRFTPWYSCIKHIHNHTLFFPFNKQ